MYSKAPGEKSSHDLQGGPPVPCYPAASLLDRLCAAGKIDKIEMIWKDLRVFSTQTTEINKHLPGHLLPRLLKLTILPTESSFHGSPWPAAPVSHGFHGFVVRNPKCEEQHASPNSAASLLLFLTWPSQGPQGHFTPGLHSKHGILPCRWCKVPNLYTTQRNPEEHWHITNIHTISTASIKRSNIAPVLLIQLSRNGESRIIGEGIAMAKSNLPVYWYYLCYPLERTSQGKTKKRRFPSQRSLFGSVWKCCILQLG